MVQYWSHFQPNKAIPGGKNFEPKKDVGNPEKGPKNPLFFEAGTPKNGVFFCRKDMQKK